MSGRTTRGIFAASPHRTLDPRAVAFFTASSQVAGVVVAVLGILGLVGLFFNIAALKMLFGGGATEAAVGTSLVLCGLALLILTPERQPVPRLHLAGYLGGMLVCLIASAALWEHLSRTDLGWDEFLLAKEFAGDAGISERMGPLTTVGFLLGGLALMLINLRTRRGLVFSQAIALAIALIVSLPLIAYAYGIDAIYGIYAGITVDTGIALGVLALGLLMARPSAGVMRVVCADDVGGMMARRLLLPAVLLPLLLGMLYIHGERAGVIDESFGQPFLIILLIAGLTALVWINARGMSRLEHERSAAVAEKQAALMRSSAEQEMMAQERRRLIEELQKHAEELTSANAAKDRFLAVLSHELRTPLTPVLLTVSMLEQDRNLPEAVRDDLSTIRRNVELESRLISDLLDLTRIAKGKLQLEMRDVDLHHVVRAAIDICQREASANLIIDLAATRRFVRGDQTRLQQVFWNLIGNAQKFTPPRGAIFIRSSDAPGGMIRVEVKDTGAGIDGDVLPKLFNAFEQGVSRTERPQSGGLGLGLAISKAVIEAHSGQIGAYSDGRGRGSKFVVELPARVQVAAAPAPHPVGAPQGPMPQLAVLLVEDHEPTMRVMSRLLERMGHRVTAASTAQAALAAAKADGLDLLVCDLGLPDASGLDVMRQLRPKFAGRAIALTGYGMDSDIRASLEAGFTEHITKPVDGDALAAALRRVASRPISAS